MPRKYAPQKEEQIHGTHAVRAALANPRRRLLRLAAKAGLDPELKKMAQKRGVPIEKLSSRRGGGVRGDKPQAHQGVVLFCEPLQAPSLEDLAQSGGILLVLDQVSDIRNVGAVMRSAAYFGASGVILPAHKSPASTSGALAKTASGATEHVPLTIVPNLARALEHLQAKDYQVIGLDPEAPEDLANAPRQKNNRIACVLGAEGKGLRPNTKAHCQSLNHLAPSPNKKIKSLNISTAAAIALYVLHNNRKTET